MVEEDYRPWTEDLNRFRFYKHPGIVSAEPEEIKIGRIVEVYLTATEDTSFFEPIPDRHA